MSDIFVTFSCNFFQWLSNFYWNN